MYACKSWVPHFFVTHLKKKHKIIVSFFNQAELNRIKVWNQVKNQVRNQFRNQVKKNQSNNRVQEGLDSEFEFVINTNLAFFILLNCLLTEFVVLIYLYRIIPIYRCSKR